MKKLFFGLAATVLMGISVNAQSKLTGFTHTTTEFNMISFYTGECGNAPGFCSHLSTAPIKDNMPYTGMIKSNTKVATITMAFNEAFAAQNTSALKDNVIIVGKLFSLPKELSEKLGFTKEIFIQVGKYPITKVDGIYYCQFKL